MDIYQCHEYYRISLNKLRRMQRDKVLKVEPDKTPQYWLQAISDIRKGTLSARSIALAYKFPDKLEKIHHLTRANRRVIDTHFKSIRLPENLPDLEIFFSAPLGAVEKHSFLMGQFVDAVQKLTPAYDVDYYYLAVRILLIACETDFQINLMSENMTRAFSSIRDEPVMRGWWHLEERPSDKVRVIYHRPRQYDL